MKENLSHLQEQGDQQIQQTSISRRNIPASLKRKFQPPTKRDANNNNNNNNSKKRSNKKRVIAAGSGNGGTMTSRPNSRSSEGGDPTSNNASDDDEFLPEALRGLDKELIEKIQNEIMESGETIIFDDIAGLEDAKQTVQELVCWPMKRPDLFTGLRRGPNGLLLFGPPGTGKTLIGKA
eukprot:CAMPEP_0194144492 /NCGR_PEP_ID=MMETSP0152-20130528/13547_1 /TAXON_ID=1049557 /ORGANISM="Thalassiothrix antarctica, Strain L6-D1" /LENGTH=178 /DNA_ID=CAMNT_0038844373 /DNA_START=83 /DNA_END=615 /DNA_ORIENTATION=-